MLLVFATNKEKRKIYFYFLIFKFNLMHASFDQFAFDKVVDQVAITPAAMFRLTALTRLQHQV